MFHHCMALFDAAIRILKPYMNIYSLSYNELMRGKNDFSKAPNTFSDQQRHGVFERIFQRRRRRRRRL